MKEKLLKVLNIKIDAINRNIENLNYLNGELEKNNNDLKYIQTMIDLFKDNEILNFADVSKNDFDKILFMIDSSVSEIFKEKTCNYDGIIYIIQGIRQSISLQLTEEQNSAILKFIEGMKNKEINLQEVISDLFESKNRLPETDLTILQSNLENFKNIISKFENELYLTEIDDISESLDFASVPIEEKSDIFEYILKYNSNIYNSLKEEEKEVESNDISIPEFKYEPIDLMNDTFEENIDIKENDNNDETNKIDDISFNLDNIISENNIENNINTDTNDNVPIDNVEPETPIVDFNTLNIDNTFDKKDNDDNEVDNNFEDLKVNEDNHELNTVELEDIIQKIDAKLKEMEFEEENNSLYNNNLVDIENIFNKYNLPIIELSKNSSEEINLMLATLSENNLLEYLKTNTELLKAILENNNNNDLQNLISLIKENFVVKDNFTEILELIIMTMPILFANTEVINSFKENIEFYKEKDINIINLFDNYRELLIIDHAKLEENYNCVMSYGFEIDNDNIKYLLYNKDVLKKLDYYIEAIGYEKGFLGKEDSFDGIEYIRKNPYKLNDIDRDALIKLRYASENGIKIYGNKPGILSGEITNPKVNVLNISDEYNNLYFDSNYKFIDENNYKTLKNEIDNTLIFDMTVDDCLNKLDEKYKKSNLRYKINNVVISRIKTIRVYNILKEKLSRHDALLIALTYNSVLKIEEYENIQMIVDSIVGGN